MPDPFKNVKIIELMELFDDEEVTTADKIDRPERAIERQAIDDFMERNPLADGGMLVKPGFGGVRQGYRKSYEKKLDNTKTRKDTVAKNIRLTPEGRYRFATEIGPLVKEGNRMGSKTFPKGTKLSEVIKFRDDNYT